MLHCPVMTVSSRWWLALVLAGLGCWSCGTDEPASNNSTGGTGAAGATGGATSTGGHGGGQGAAGGEGGGSNTCSATFVDCDPAVPGCDTDINTDPAHCGDCDQPCSLVDHATSTCTDQECGFDCIDGWGDCNDDPADGCETNTDSHNSHCGACGVPCEPGDHADASCGGGVCQQTCVSGWWNCNGLPGDGCEQSLGDVESCGACDVVCPAEDGTAACLAGGCAVLIGPAPTAVSDLAVGGGYLIVAAPATGIFRLPTSGGALEALVLGGSAVDKLVGVGGSDVYYPVVVGSSVVVRSIPIAGGSPSDVGTLTIGPVAQISGFAVGSTHVFVTVNDELWSLPLGGGAGTSVATTESHPTIANGMVYYIHGPSHTLRASPEAGGAEIVVSSDTFTVLNHTTHLAVNTQYAFVGNATMRRVTLTSGTSQSHGSFFMFASDLAVDAVHVYHVGSYGGGGNNHHLGRRLMDDATNNTLTPDYQGSTSAIVLDATHVYFAAGTTILKMAK